MGQIINTRNLPNKKVICKILLDPQEIITLKGHMKNIHLFGKEQFTTHTEINERGSNGVTKYFKIPLSIRSRKKHNGELDYQKIDTASKVFYIYTLGLKNKEENQ